MLNDLVRIKDVLFIDRLIFRFCILFCKEDLNRHKGTIFFQNLSCPVLICKFQTIFIQEQCDLCSHFRLAAVLHLVLCTALAYPVYRHSPIFVRKCIDMHFVRNHKCRVESQTKMSDHLIICRFIFIFLKELGCSGKCDLCDIFFYLFRSHSQTIINKLQRLLFRIHQYLDLAFVIVRKLIFSHHIQLFQLRDRIAAIGNELSHKNVMIRIHPFLNDRKYIFTVD